MSSALSALQTNTAALRVVANNISNVNTPDYARRQVDLQTLTAGGNLGGVEIADIQRVVDQFLNQESLSASASASRYDAQSNTFDQISALLGTPGDGTALTSKLSDIFKALGQAQLSPTMPSSQDAVVSAMSALASSISQMSDSLTGLQNQINSQVSTAVTSVNTLTKQIYDLNNLIKLASAQGQSDTAYLDQRDAAVASLAKLIDVRSIQQGDGSVLVTTQDGISLIGGTYAKLTYGPAQNGAYSTIQMQETDPRTGQPIGTSQSLDSHLSAGSIKGLIEVRDGTLADLKDELGGFAQGVAQSFNSVHNANSAYPPPQVLTGRDTALVGTDALGFSGQTNIILTDTSGVLKHTISLDFTNQTVKLDGATQAVTFPTTISALKTLLNTQLSACGGSGAGATFSGGVLGLSAGSGYGLVVSDPAPNPSATPPAVPSSRGGVGFSQFFGLNDLFRTPLPSITTTGLTSTDTCGTSGDLTIVVKDANGRVVSSGTVTAASTDTFSAFASDLNAEIAPFGTYRFNPADLPKSSTNTADGSMTLTLNAGYTGYTVEVTSDATSRGDTGLSLGQLFGLGSSSVGDQAVGFAVNPVIANNPSLIAFAKANPAADGTANNPVVGAGDSSGLLALQNLATTQQTFTQAGALGSQVTTLVNYASALYQDVATRSSTAKTNQTTQDDRLSEAQTRLSNNSGVSIDEELSNMMMYQQAYNAGARMLTVVGQLYDTLLQIV